MGTWPLTDKYSVCTDTETKAIGFDFFFSPAKIGGEGYEFSGSKSNLGVIAAPIGKVDNILTNYAIQNSITSLTSINTYEKFNFLKAGYTLYMANDALNVAVDDIKIADCNSVPIIVTEPRIFQYEISKSEDLRNTIYHSFRGRNGEVRTIDHIGETFKVTINGEEQDINDYPNLCQYMQYKLKDSRFGEWDIEITDNNCYVDDVKGTSVTKLHFNDKAEDVCPPTLQMLQTLDNDNKVTDKFGAPNQGNLTFVGGDFNYYYDVETHNAWFEVSDCHISVEWSVAGANDWSSLSCEVVPSKFKMPGWGYYWEASLADIPTPSVDTKYDLRITLTDLNGNSQQQYLSPVFTIAGSTGIANTIAPTGNVKYYNLQGMEIENPTPGTIYIERYENGACIKRVK